MDRPTTLPIKDWLIRNLSVEKRISERIIHAVVSHQSDMLTEKMKEVHSVEISGFGKFIFNKKKAYKKLYKYLYMKEAMEYMMRGEDEGSPKQKKIEFKYKALLNDIECLKQRLGEDIK